MLAITSGVLSALFWTAPAHAHNSFTGSNPKNGARVAEAPDTVALTFLAKLEPASTKVTVTGPDGAGAGAGEPAVKGNTVRIGVRAAGGGDYTVAYQVVSIDGHPVKGKIRFTVTASPTPGAAAEPTSASPSPAVAASSAALAATTYLVRRRPS